MAIGIDGMVRTGRPVPTEGEPAQPNSLSKRSKQSRYLEAVYAKSRD